MLSIVIPEVKEIIYEAKQQGRQECGKGIGSIV